MGTSSKVKVSTEKLLEAVKARRSAMVGEYERALAKYDKDKDVYAGKVCDAFRKALARAESGRLPDHVHSYRAQQIVVPVRFDKPSKPTIRTDQIDRLIATLEIASEATMMISAEDAAHYLG